MIIDLRSFNFVKPGFRWEFADPKNVRNPSTSWCQNQWLHGFPREKRIPTKMARWKVEMLWYVLNCWYLMIRSCTLGLGIHVTCYIPTFCFHSLFPCLGMGIPSNFLGQDRGAAAGGLLMSFFNLLMFLDALQAAAKWLPKRWDPEVTQEVQGSCVFRGHGMRLFAGKNE